MSLRLTRGVRFIVLHVTFERPRPFASSVRHRTDPSRDPVQPCAVPAEGAAHQAAHSRLWQLRSLGRLIRPPESSWVESASPTHRLHPIFEEDSLCTSY